MRYVSYSVRGTKTRLYFIGDIHAGARACDVEKLRSHVQKIAAERNAFVVLMGDLVDALKRLDPRFSADGIWDWLALETDIVGAQAEWVVRELGPLRGKIIAAVIGNHEQAIIKHHEHDVHRSIVRALETQDMGYSGLLVLTNGKRSYSIMLSHGTGKGSTLPSVVRTLETAISQMDCDAYVMGHRHALCWTQVCRYCPKSDVDICCRWGICSGTYLCTFDSRVDTYSSVSGFSPRITGCAYLDIDWQSMSSFPGVLT